VKVGEATASRRNLIGEPVPAKYPAAQRALSSGALSAQAAAVIIALLDRVRLKIGAARTAEAERLLVEPARPGRTRSRPSFRRRTARRGAQ